MVLRCRCPLRGDRHLSGQRRPVVIRYSPRSDGEGQCRISGYVTIKPEFDRDLCVAYTLYTEPGRSNLSKVIKLSNSYSRDP